MIYISFRQSYFKVVIFEILGAIRFRLG